MKKLTKILSMLMMSILALTMMVGCGSPKVAPDESAKIVLDIILKDDNSRIGDIKMTQEEYDEVRKEMEDSMMAAFDQSGYNIADDTKQLLYDAMIEGMTKIEYETVLISEEKNTATVELKIKGFDMPKITEELTPIVQEYYLANPTMTQDEILDYTFKKEAELIKQGYIKQEANSLTLTFTKESNVWIPNESEFMKIGQAMVS